MPELCIANFARKILKNAIPPSDAYLPDGGIALFIGINAYSVTLVNVK